MVWEAVRILARVEAGTGRYWCPLAQRMNLARAEWSIALVLQEEMKEGNGSSRATGIRGADRCFVDGNTPGK